jgi:drug/metabolite transporter (DMT)-like permease
LTENSQFRAYAALVAVWIFWGTTYLAIRISLESFPPFLMIAARFIISGALMLIGAKLSGATLPRGRDLRLTALYGIIVLGGGNGCLVFAEQTVPSGLAALLVTTSPFWMVGLESFFEGGERSHPPTLGGILVGFFGVVLLVAPFGSSTHLNGGMLGGIAILQLGCFLWCLGAILQRRHPTQVHPVVSGAIQQLATGLAFLLPAAIIPEHPIHWSARGTWALLYLVMFGSILGYSAFIYALHHLPVAVVTTYNYVNPIVAVFLGWLVYREPFGIREMAAMLVIFLGVGIVKWTSQKKMAAAA